MKTRAIALIAAVLLALVAQVGGAAVGINRTAVPPNSDVRMTVPFNRTVEATFTVDSVDAEAGTVAVTVDPPLADDQYADAFYVRFVDGDGEGLWSTVSSNGTSEFTLEDAGVLDHVAVDDTFRVYKHHTLRSIFPEGMKGISFTDSTRILLFDNDPDAMAQNKSAWGTAFYVGGNWIGGAGINNDTPLEPETQFIVRNNEAFQLQVFTMGAVPDYEVSVLVGAGGDMDIGSGYPVPVKLKDSGLGGDGRQILLYDSDAAGQNKSAFGTAFYVGGSWFGGAGITGETPIEPSQSISLRLPGDETAEKVAIDKPYP